MLGQCCHISAPCHVLCTCFCHRQASAGSFQSDRSESGANRIISIRSFCHRQASTESFQSDRSESGKSQASTGSFQSDRSVIGKRQQDIRWFRICRYRALTHTHTHVHSCVWSTSAVYSQVGIDTWHHFFLLKVGIYTSVLRWAITPGTSAVYSQVGIDTWHHEHNPQGVTVEMHGNIRCVCARTCVFMCVYDSVNAFVCSLHTYRPIHPCTLTHTTCALAHTLTGSWSALPAILQSSCPANIHMSTLRIHV